MSVHYKFKSALDFDTITFDGLHISVADLKKSIIHQKRLGKTADFDLQITNAQTKEEYTDDVTLIPKNTSLIIARIPLAVQPKKPWDPQAEKVQGVRQIPEPDSGTLDLSQMNGTEEDKIQAMMIQSTMEYDPNNYQKIRGQGQTGEVPANYRCFKCHKPGHWIKNCPLGSSGEISDVKRNTGIPRSFIERDSQEKTAEQQAQHPPVPEKKQEIPDDLICSICKDLFTDAVMIPCCGSSFCDDCVRTSLLESEDNECPDCKEKGSSPGSLIPNRFLRNSVNAFKNETGYNKPRQRKEPAKPKEAPTLSPAPTPAAIPEVPNSNATPVESVSKDKPKMEEKDKEPVKEKKEKKENEVPEKKVDPGALSSHDESDFEDNITVTVPPAHLQAPPSNYKDRQYNGRHSRHPRPPGLEHSPKTVPAMSPHERRSRTPTVDEKDEKESNDPHHKHHQVPSHSSSRDSMRHHRATPSDVYGGGPPMASYSQGQPPMMGPGRPFDMGVYGPPPGPGYPPYLMGDRMRGPYHGPPRGGFAPHMHQMRPRHMAPPGTLASVYQGVAAKVGTGIIDDPLEAFNRIMREKEKRKEERRRSPDRRRSRSIEMNVGRMRHSPPQYNRGRMRSPEDRRLRTPPPRERERRGRSREREKRSIEKDKRRHRSSSFSDRSSRSRSWSIQPRRRTKSPPMMRRRSRSRSPSFSMSRYRQKENRRPDRREEFPREEFRDRSPYHYQSRRPRSRGRMMSPGPPHRQERMSNHQHGQEQFFHQMPPAGMYNEAPYPQNNNRYGRDGPGMPIRESYGRDRNPDYKMDRFDDGPPGTDEPPPPGFENSPERIRRNSWNHNQFDDHMFRDEYRKPEGGKKDYMHRINTPEMHEMQSIEREERHRHEMREREGRSWSPNTRHSPNNQRRRRSRSRSPVRIDRLAERFSSRDRNPSKERHSNRELNRDSNRESNRDTNRDMNRDNYNLDRLAHIEKERIEHEKLRLKLVRDAKSTEKKHSDRKGHEKESRREEKEKYKDQEKEKEKEKRRESSSEEKKDKKTKEKRKKKKEKDMEKKKKKEKKEKEKKVKEREKEKEEEAKQILKEAEKLEHIAKEKDHCEENILPEEQIKDKIISKIDEMELEKPTEEDETTFTGEQEQLGHDDGNVDDAKSKQDPDVIDLYGDICQEEEIRYEYANNSSENTGEEEKLDKENKKTSPKEIKRFDSVLDIHDFEPDLDDMPKEEPKKETNVLVPLPELSKWERDEESLTKEEKRVQSLMENSGSSDEKSGKVTTEVIRRAENAIFARAINAIRPIEIKKISVERQKLYANEPMRDLGSPTSLVIKGQSPNAEMPTFQITVPTKGNSCERSVEIKSDKPKRTTPVRSVKDRLGSKVAEPPVKRNRSRSTTPPRKITIQGNRSDKLRPGRSRSKERSRVEENKDNRRGSEIRRANETNRSRDRNNKVVDNIRPREPPLRPRENDRRRDHVGDRSRDRQWEQERQRDVDREKERQREKEREREKEKEKEREKEKPKDKERRRSPEKGRERPRERERNFVREPERVKDKQPSPTRDNKSKERHRSKDDEKPRQLQHLREETRKDRSSSRNSDKKRNRREKDNKRKLVDDQSLDQQKRPKLEKHERDSKDHSLQRKKSIIDEANFVPDYDEQPDQENLCKTNESNNKKLEKTSKEKVKSPESNKRSRTASPSSSSSSSSDSESNSDSDDNKKKKKRKHKKKKSKRASSQDSTNSAKHKRSKSKKKSKSSKKKKKNKK